MTAYTWIGGTGNWNVAANWSPTGGPPKATDTATISATGAAYTVTIDSADVAQSLTENSSSATVDDAGSLTLSATFTLSAGSAQAERCRAVRRSSRAEPSAAMA